jgi:hypothetical protein
VLGLLAVGEEEGAAGCCCAVPFVGGGCGLFGELVGGLKVRDGIWRGDGRVGRVLDF